MQVYLVGGAVRDRLLGRKVRERDYVVVGASPDAMLAKGYRPVGKDFPVFLHPDTHAEYALARTERKTAPGYHGFALNYAPGVTLEEDLARRDLTINAMAEDASGTLIDPYGGRRDLEEKWLRHVSPAFAEDPVRILRVARFLARYGPLGFRVAPETRALMRAMVAAGEVAALVPERVCAETLKALKEEAPAEYFRELGAAHALPVLLPELALRLKESEAPLASLGAAAALSPEPRIRYAALTAGLSAEPLAGAAAALSMSTRLKVPNEYRELAVLVSAHRPRIEAALELSAPRLLDLLEALDALRRPERYAEALLACEAHARGAGAGEYPARAYLLAALEAMRSVRLADAERAGLAGDEIAKRLREKRLLALGEIATR
jgi:tRNA nucleotidyltransferase (CCA-adding enzyme)